MNQPGMNPLGAAGQVRVPTGRICTLDQVARAHADLESGQVTGKLVVTTS